LTGTLLGECWNLRNGPLTLSISPGFYNRTGRGGSSNTLFHIIIPPLCRHKCIPLYVYHLLMSLFFHMHFPLFPTSGLSQHGLSFFLSLHCVYYLNTSGLIISHLNTTGLGNIYKMGRMKIKDRKRFFYSYLCHVSCSS
jgi:hypothetical protein